MGNGACVDLAEIPGQQGRVAYSRICQGIMASRTLVAALPMGMDMRKLSRLAYQLHSRVQWPGLVISMELCRDLIAALPNFSDWATVVTERDVIVNRWLDLAAFQRLSERISQRVGITLDPFVLITLLTTEQDNIQKNRKLGPFRIVRLDEKYARVAFLMDALVRQVKELPDFSGDRSILVASDFGGEHIHLINLLLYS